MAGDGGIAPAPAAPCVLPATRVDLGDRFEEPATLLQSNHLTLGGESRKAEVAKNGALGHVLLPLRPQPDAGHDTSG